MPIKDIGKLDDLDSYKLGSFELMNPKGHLPSDFNFTYGAGICFGSTNYQTQIISCLQGGLWYRTHERGREPLEWVKIG